MTITVQKQVEEIVEVFPPCYYHGLTGYQYINASGVLVTINDSLISYWMPTERGYYADEISRIVRNGKPCTKEEFELKYAEVLAKIEAAVAGNNLAAQSFIAEASAAEGLGAMAE